MVLPFLLPEGICPVRIRQDCRTGLFVCVEAGYATARRLGLPERGVSIRRAAMLSTVT